MKIKVNLAVALLLGFITMKVGAHTTVTSTSSTSSSSGTGLGTVPVPAPGSVTFCTPAHLEGTPHSELEKTGRLCEKINCKLIIPSERHTYR